MTDRPLRVAVVGGGPAGLYATDFLTFDGDGSVEVDVFERLPVPFGLLRYGVAPDHLNIKAAGRLLLEVLQRPGVRLFGHVGIGRDVTVEELRTGYDAVVYALGASADRRLGIPGEELPGSSSATAFVNWYNGHPECELPDVLEAESVAVVGVGNVAVDVARILLKDPEALVSTDVPQPVLERLRSSKVTDVHVLGRRGPAFAKFTTKELKELGELAGVDVIVDGEIPDDAPDGAAPMVKRNLAVLREWSARQPTEARRRLHLHFGARPEAILGDDRVAGLRLDRTTADGTGTGTTWELQVQAVLRSVGYRGIPLEGVPFDGSQIPNATSRVLRDGRPSVGEYCVGWIKRGPTGVLGTNRSDAEEAVASLREDRPALLAARTADPGGVARLLEARGHHHVDLDGWLAVLEREERHGAAHGRGRVKIADWDELLEAARLPRRQPSAS